MKELNDFYNEKGQEFIDKLLNSDLKVTEKITGTKFGFNKSTNTIKYYKRDDRFPISQVDRTISSLYENPINYINSLDLSSIPTNYQFCFDYFHNTKPLSISYDNLPKNGLILSHIKDLNAVGDKSIINDTKSLRKWSNLLKVDMPLVAFEGKLSEDQKNEITQFINTNPSELKELFKTNSFAQHILGILNKKIGKTTLNNNTQNPLEGFLFTFNSDEKHTVKTIDPLFKQIQSYNQKSMQRHSSDEVGLIIYKFVEWLEDSSALEGVSSHELSSDEKYLDIMTELISKFITDNSTFIDGLDIKKPVFAILPEFRLNTKFIKNDRIVNYIATNPDTADIYKLLIASFRRDRKKTTTIIDESLLKLINSYVKKIKETTNTVNEFTAYSFLEWKRHIKDK